MLQPAVIIQEESGGRFPSSQVLRIPPMRRSISGKSVPLVRLAAAAILVLAGWMIAGPFSVGGADQDPGKPAAAQGKAQPSKNKPSGRKPKEEEEEPSKPR